MADFTIHTKDTVPEDGKETIDAIAKTYGFVPNLLGGLAEAPPVAKAYMEITLNVMAASLSPAERHVAWFAINAFHECHYCMAAHSAIATGEKIPADVIEAARAGGGYADAKLQAMHDFAVKMVETRGWVDEAGVQAFLDAGFTKRNVLEVVLIAAHKTLSNYSNHLMNTPVDDAFAPFAWEAKQAAE
ncbi:MAG: carboxymuconolactone decarboxylase family protein [Pseudomonadota bacterium]